MGYFRRVLHLLSYACYIVIGVYALVCIPLIFRYKPEVVLTGSMEPTYKVGSIIYYKPVSMNDIKVGDVITFKVNNTIVTHRVNSIKNNDYITKGDANNAVDTNPVAYASVLGKVGKLYVPFLGYGVKYINDHMLLFGIIIIILILEFIASNKRKE